MVSGERWAIRCAGVLHRDMPPDLRLPALSAEFAPVFLPTKALYHPRQVNTLQRRARKRGELKYLLLTASQRGDDCALRALRSEAKVAQLRAARCRGYEHSCRSSA